MYFIDGKYQEGTWERKGPNAPTEYLDGSGQPIRLAPGKVWIQVVPDNMDITYSRNIKFTKMLQILQLKKWNHLTIRWYNCNT